jgi:hypothetical protein
MSNPSGDEEEVKELVSREGLSHVPQDPEQEGERIYREGHSPPFDDPENDAAEGSWGIWLLAVIPLAIVAYVLYLVLS